MSGGLELLSHALSPVGFHRPNARSRRSSAACTCSSLVARNDTASASKSINSRLGKGASGGRPPTLPSVPMPVLASVPAPAPVPTRFGV